MVRKSGGRSWWAPNKTIVVPKKYFWRGWWDSHGLDIALIFLSGDEFFGGDFGPVEAQQLYAQPIKNGDSVIKYGRGISQYAKGVLYGLAVPAFMDGKYRSAIFSATIEPVAEICTGR